MAGAALALCLALAGVTAQEAQPQRAFWSLVVNDVPKGEVLGGVDGDRLWLPVAALERAGLRGFQGQRATLFGEPYVLLQSLAPDITTILDTANVVVRLTAAPRFFEETRVIMQRPRPAGIVNTQSRSAFLNYSASWDQLAGSSGFGEAGIALHRSLTAVSGFTVYPDGQFARGLSTLTWDHPEKRLRFQLGDIVAAPTPLGSGPTLAGLAFGRDYSLDPYYYRYPTPFVRGTTAAPSDVEIYVNDALVRRVSITPGPYRFDRLPLNSGLGNVRVVVRDRLGREQIFQSSEYLATGVLKRGDQDFQYLAGIRRDDAEETPAYHEWSATAYHRVGLTDWLTAGFSGEGRRDVAAGGPTVNVRLARLGEFEAQTWASGTRDGTPGLGVYALYTFASRWLTAGATLQQYDDGFANLLTDPGMFAVPEFYQANAGVPLFRSGSVNYTWQRKRSSAAEFGFTTAGGTIDELLVRSRSHSLRAAFRLFGGTQLSGTATYTTVRDRHLWSGFAGLTVTFGRDTTASVTYSDFPGSRSTYASLEKPRPVGVGYGYRVTASDLEDGTASGQLDLNTPHTHLTLRYDALNGGDDHAASGTIAGGLILTRGGVFFTRELEQSSAVVEVKGLKNVRVLADNVPVGRTNGSGRLIIPDLLPYLANRISLEEADIPFQYSIPVLSQLVAPPFRGAAYVSFVTTRIQGRDGFVRLSIDGKEVVPAYGNIVVQLDGREVPSPLNAEGAFFLDLPDGRHTATVSYNGVTCTVTIDATPTSGLIQHLGVLRCTP